MSAKKMNAFLTKLNNTLSEVSSTKGEELTVQEVVDTLRTDKNFKNLFKQPQEKKDPNKPKRPNTSYIFFCNKMRPTITAQNSGMVAVDVTKRLGELWRNLDPNEKVQYEMLAKQDRDRYDEEMKKYVPTPGTEQKQGRKKRQVQTGPKKPLTSYMYFCQAQRQSVKESNPNLTVTQITSELARLWKGLSDVQRAQYDEIKRQEKAKYDALVAQSNPVQPANSVQPSPALVNASVPPTLTRQTQPRKSRKLEDQPGFQVFSQQQRPLLQSTNKNLTAKALDAAVRKQWQGLTAQQKAQFAAVSTA